MATSMSGPDTARPLPHWGWLVGLGALMLVLGFLGLLMVGVLTVASVLFFGILLLIGGGAQIVHAFSVRGWRPVLTHALLALLYIGTGLLIVIDPLSASLGLTIFLAGLLVAIGAVRVVFAIQNRQASGWGWALVAGVIAVALGVLIFLQWPLSGLWVIGLFVAIDMLTQGTCLIALGLGLRRIAGSQSAAAPA